MSRRTLILAVLLMFAFAGIVHACPMCKDSIPNSDVSGAVAVPSGFNASVYSMLVGFLAVLALISGVCYKGISDSNRYNESLRKNFKKPTNPADPSAKDDDQPKP